MTARTRQKQVSARPRENPLAPGLLARVFHQPSLIYFNAVARTLSVREAGRQLNIASSAVTRQVSQLEDALGVSLFHREKRRLRLSPAGEILYRHARRLTAPIEAAVSEIEMLRGIKTGRVRIATVESVGLSFLPTLLTDFARKYPRLNIDVTILSAAGVLDILTEERADIGFGFVSRLPRQIEISEQRDLPVGVLVTPGHPLAAVESPTVADCIAYPLAVASPEISIREVIDPFLYEAAAVMPPLVEVDSIRMLVELARKGHFASITTPIGAQEECNAGELVFRPLQDRGLPTNRFGILVRSIAGLQFAPAVFYEHAKWYFQSLRFPGEL